MDCRDRVRGGSDDNDRYGDIGRNLLRGAEAEDVDVDANYYSSPSYHGGLLTSASSVAMRGAHLVLADGFCLFWDDEWEKEHYRWRVGVVKRAGYVILFILASFGGWGATQSYAFAFSPEPRGDGVLC